MNDVLFWNQQALEASRLDYATELPTDKLNPEQGGPTLGSRALAMIHVAMHDAFVGGPQPTYLTYPGVPANATSAFKKAALATAAFRTITALYCRQMCAQQATYSQYMQGITGSQADIRDGVAWGEQVARAILADRTNDGSQASGDYTPSDAPGFHRRDPIDFTQGFLGPRWGEVRPFGITNLLSDVPMVPPPPLNSALYATAFDDVKNNGSLAGGSRTAEQTRIGLFWAYDGARNIGLPPRLYDQVVRAIVQSMATPPDEDRLVKLFAIVNVAMADAGIHAWAEKYRFRLWRPVVGIRESDEKWGPGGLGDGNAATAGDPFWIPLGAPRSNQSLPSFTPAFPAYPSGHATFGTAAFEAAKTALGLPGTHPFEFVSDELNGTTFGLTGVRPKYSFKGTIDDAIEENARSRIYLGVHWQFDADEGVTNGRAIGQKIAAAFPARA